MKSLLQPYLLTAIIAAALVAAIWIGTSQRAEIQRLRSNQQQLLSPQTIVEYRTTSDGKAVAQVQALNLQVSELKHANDSLLQLTRQLHIKNRNLIAIAQAATLTNTHISAPISAASS